MERKQIESRTLITSTILTLILAIFATITGTAAADVVTNENTTYYDCSLDEPTYIQQGPFFGAISVEESVVYASIYWEGLKIDSETLWFNFPDSEERNGQGDNGHLNIYAEANFSTGSQTAYPSNYLPWGKGSWDIATSQTSGSNNTDWIIEIGDATIWQVYLAITDLGEGYWDVFVSVDSNQNELMSYEELNNYWITPVNMESTVAPVTAVPEPATMTLLSLGALAFIRRRK